MRKSYSGYDEKNQDITFELSEGEYPLCCSRVEMSDSDSPGTCLITIYIDHNYKFYLFRPEVKVIDEYTPDYYGWDSTDRDMRVLMESRAIDNIDKLYPIIKLFHFDTRYYSGGEDEDEYINESPETLHNRLLNQLRLNV